MNCMIYSQYGQVCDRLVYMLNNIYAGNNYYDRPNNKFEAKSKIFGKDIIIVDENLEYGYRGIEFLNEIKNHVNYKNKVIYLCMPNTYEDMMTVLNEQNGEYEYWFKILTKGSEENELRKLLEE